MGLKSASRYRLAVLVLLGPLLLVGCYRSASRADSIDIAGRGEEGEERPVQVMPTAFAPAAEPVAEDLEVTVEAAVSDQPTVEPTPVPPTPEATAVPALPTEPAPEPAPVPTALPAEEEVHVVLPGDTLVSIAGSYGVSLEELAARNGIVNLHQLEVGQELVIPVPGSVAPEMEAVTGELVHVVEPGDDLFRIALEYGLSFETVAAYNDIPWPCWIYAGQEIRIPAGE